MNPIRYVTALIRNLRQTDSLNRDLGAEFDAYVAVLAAVKERSGVPPEAARRAALLEAGGYERVREEVQRVRAGAVLSQIAQEGR